MEALDLPGGIRDAAEKQICAAHAIADGEQERMIGSENHAGAIVKHTGAAFVVQLDGLVASGQTINGSLRSAQGVRLEIRVGDRT